MTDTKITFPRLKANSDYGNTQFTTKTKTMNTLPTERIR